MKNIKLINGVALKELVRHKDERGYFEELIRVSDDFFQEGFGQLSHSVMYPGVIKAWHIHKTQTDWWFVASGDLKVALYDTRLRSSTYKRTNEFILGEHGDNFILKIPPKVAHGCKVIGVVTELVYVTSTPYDQSEEGRIPYDDPSIGYNWLKIAPFK